MLRQASKTLKFLGTSLFGNSEDLFYIALLQSSCCRSRQILVVLTHFYARFVHFGSKGTMNYHSYNCQYQLVSNFSCSFFQLRKKYLQLKVIKFFDILKFLN